jgi:hypothetical protein
MEILKPLYSNGKAIKIHEFIVQINNRWQYDVTMNKACIINEQAVLGYDYRHNLELCFNTEWIDQRWHEN